VVAHLLVSVQKMVRSSTRMVLGAGVLNAVVAGATGFLLHRRSSSFGEPAIPMDGGSEDEPIRLPMDAGSWSKFDGGRLVASKFADFLEFAADSAHSGAGGLLRGDGSPAEASVVVPSETKKGACGDATRATGATDGDVVPAGFASKDDGGDEHAAGEVINPVERIVWSEMSRFVTKRDSGVSVSLAISQAQTMRKALALTLHWVHRLSDIEINVNHSHKYLNRPSRFEYPNPSQEAHVGRRLDALIEERSDSENFKRDLCKELSSSTTEAEQSIFSELLNYWDKPKGIDREQFEKEIQNRIDGFVTKHLEQNRVDFLAEFGTVWMESQQAQRELKNWMQVRESEKE